MSAGDSRLTIRQNTQSTIPTSGLVYTLPARGHAAARSTCRVSGPASLGEPEGDCDGHLPQVQDADPEERQSREARLGVAAQALPAPEHRGQARLIRASAPPASSGPSVLRAL